MDTFFPTEDYKMPETSNYMKLTPGEHTFRILSSAIVGYEYFTTDKKVVRSTEPFEETPNINGDVKHFWAFVIWNYDAKKLQIMEVTQKTIMTPMSALINSTKWGNPKTYDITITRKGTNKNDTEYAVMPNPKAEVESEILEAYENSKIKLENLYDGTDPFK